MREIIFRGKRLDNGKWIEGYYMQRNNKPRIVVEKNNNLEVYEVNPSTVGQYTGLKDKNGKRIWEGDVLLSESWCKGSRSKNPYHTVLWEGVSWRAKGYNGELEVNPDLDVKNDFEVIGNIHDNPELI